MAEYWLQKHQHRLPYSGRTEHPQATISIHRQQVANAAKHFVRITSCKA